MTKIIWIVAVFIIVALLVYVFLPRIINAAGLHPKYTPSKTYQFSGQKVLIISTSQAQLVGAKKPTDTGVYGSELLIPYYVFKDSGLDVTLASIKGGVIPIEPQSLRWPIKTEAEERYLKDAGAQQVVANSIAVDKVDFSQYDMVYIAGGWGAAYDLLQSEALAKGVSDANANDAVLGSVCHGALGLIGAVDENNNPLLKGRQITGVTNKQIEELGISFTPLHPETELKKVGAQFKANTAFRDMLANLVIIDGNIVTGQNQNGSMETAYTMMRLLDEKQ